jgi:hypothetical protein
MKQGQTTAGAGGLISPRFYPLPFEQKQPTLFRPPLFVGEGQKILLKLA